MEFTISHLVSGLTRSEFEQLFFDETLNIELCKRLKLERTLLSLRCEGQRFEREVEITLRRHVPAWVLKLVGERRMAYRERMQYCFGQPSGPARWRITPLLFTRQVDCSGTVEFEPCAHGVMRHVRGHVHVRIAAIGKIVERFAVREIEKSFNEAADLTDQWLAANWQRRA